MTIQSVALLGADGHLGPAVLHELLAAAFTVTVLKRAGSTQPDAYPSGVRIARIPDDMDVAQLTPILRGQDALVLAIKGSQTDVQFKLAQAAVAAGVQRLIPADFGSVDSASRRTQALVPLYAHKTALRERVAALAAQHPAFSWTSLVCGHFFDWDPAFLHIFPRERRADVLDDGARAWSASTLRQIGRATARVLRCPEPTRNRIVYVQSFLVSQNAVLRALEKATGGEWSVRRFESKQYEKEEKAKADAGDLEAVENLVWMLGALDADWTQREGFAMEMLGLEEESLQEVVDGMMAAWRREGRM